MKLVRTTQSTQLLVHSRVVAEAGRSAHAQLDRSVRQKPDGIKARRLGHHNRERRPNGGGGTGSVGDHDGVAAGIVGGYVAQTQVGGDGTGNVAAVGEVGPVLLPLAGEGGISPGSW